MPYTFALTDNSASYVSRTATIDVTSNDLGFPSPLFFDVVQAGASPYINITDPDPAAHDFGATTALDVEFKTNASWKYETDANYAHVVAGATYLGSPLAAGTVTTDATSPQDEVTGVVTFTPVVGAIPAPLGTISTDVTFRTETTGLGGVTEGSDVVTLTRENPQYLALVSSTPAADGTVPVTGGDVTVVVNTNTDWWMQLNSDNPSAKSITPGTYATNSSHYVSLAARVPGNTASWRTSPTNTISYGYDATTVGSFNVTQLPYSVTLTSGLPGSILTGSSTLSFSVTTNAPTTYSYTLQIKSGGVLASLSTTGSGTKEIVIPTNTTGSDRTLKLFSYEMNAQLGADMSQAGHTYYLELANPDYDPICTVGTRIPWDQNASIISGLTYYGVWSAGWFSNSTLDLWPSGTADVIYTGGSGSGYYYTITAPTAAPMFVKTFVLCYL
jgi:hypothetical protein